MKTLRLIFVSLFFISPLLGLTGDRDSAGGNSGGGGDFCKMELKGAVDNLKSFLDSLTEDQKRELEVTPELQMRVEQGLKAKVEYKKKLMLNGEPTTFIYYADEQRFEVVCKRLYQATRYQQVGLMWHEFHRLTNAEYEYERSSKLYNKIIEIVEGEISNDDDSEVRKTRATWICKGMCYIGKCDQWMNTDFTLGVIDSLLGKFGIGHCISNDWFIQQRVTSSGINEDDAYTELQRKCNQLNTDPKDNKVHLEKLERVKQFCYAEGTEPGT